MRIGSKQIVSIVSVIAILVILVYPALATGGATVHLESSAIEKADHVYATVGAVFVHRSGQPGSEGWQLVLNQSQTVDLMSLDGTGIGLGSGQVALGDYDGVRIEVSNVTWVFNQTTTKLQLESSEVQSSIEFTIQAGREVVITLALTGYQEEIGGISFFVPTLNTTLD